MVDNTNANSRLSNLLFVRDRGSIIEEPAALLVICVIMLLSSVVPEPTWAYVSAPPVLAPPVFGFTGHFCSAFLCREFAAKTTGKWPRIKGIAHSYIHVSSSAALWTRIVLHRLVRWVVFAQEKRHDARLRSGGRRCFGQQ